MFKNLTIPGSKSFTNRALVLAGMCAQPVELHGFLFCDDSAWGIDALQKLGFLIETDTQKNIAKITPPTVEKFSDEFSPLKIFYGKAGTLARFFPAVILNWQKTFPDFKKIHVLATGEEQLIRRPLSDMSKALNQLGADLSSLSLPMILKSSDLKGCCRISGNTSSQFLSGLLLAAVGAKNKITILREDNLVQPDYVKMTISAINAFGGNISYDSSLQSFHIFQTKGLSTEKYLIEADASTCCYFISLAFLHNFNLKISNIGSLSLQPDIQFVSILQQMGAHIELKETEIIIHKREVNSAPKGNFCFDFSLMSDQALTIGVIALFASEPIEITHISHIRQHESDRIACFVKNLQSLSLRIEEKEDGFIVYPLIKNSQDLAGEWETWDDHRFAMSGSLLASLCPNIRIKNPECVKKTAPNFFAQVRELGLKINE